MLFVFLYFEDFKEGLSNISWINMIITPKLWYKHPTLKIKKIFNAICLFVDFKGGIIEYFLNKYHNHSKKYDISVKEVRTWLCFYFWLIFSSIEYLLFFFFVNLCLY